MKTRKLLSSLFYSISMGIYALSISTAHAETTPSTNVSYVDDATQYYKVSNCLIPTKNIDCLASGYGFNFRTLLFKPAYKQANSMLAGSVLQSILIPTSSAALSYDSDVSKSILTLISNTGTVADNLLKSTPEIFADGIVLSPTMNQNKLPINIPFLSSAISSLQKPTEAQSQSAINALSFDSLIAPTIYREVKVGEGDNETGQVNQPLVANTFIQYATGLANPMRTADFTSMKLPSDQSNRNAYLYQLQEKPTVRDYLTALRNYTAQLSVGISNFYYLYNERMPIKDARLADKASALVIPPSNPLLPPAPTGAVSPLEIEKYLATRRVSDSGWYTAMQNALPSTLLRETLFLLAEIPPMLFQLHLDLERILATMSAMQIQQTGGSRLLLEQQRDAVDKILQNPEQTQSELSQTATQAQQQANQEEMKQAAEAVKQQQ